METSSRGNNSVSEQLLCFCWDTREGDLNAVFVYVMKKVNAAHTVASYICTTNIAFQGIDILENKLQIHWTA